MIQLLFVVLAGEVAVAVALLFKTPLRRLTVLGLDYLKRGRGPIVVKTVAATALVVLASSVYSIAKIRARSAELELGALNPTDQVLLARHLLEASLMGYSLFLALVIDRLHHYVREIRRLKKSTEAVMKQNRALEESKSSGSEELQEHDREITNLNAKIKQLELEAEARLKEAKAAEASALALKKQSEGLLLEYDRLLEDNQNLRCQLQSIDESLSHSDGKKNS